MSEHVLWHSAVRIAEAVDLRQPIVQGFGQTTHFALSLSDASAGADDVAQRPARRREPTPVCQSILADLEVDLSLLGVLADYVIGGQQC